MNRTGFPLYSGFSLCGFLLSILAAALPAWGFHLTEDHSAAGGLFGSMGLGLITAGYAPRIRLSAPKSCALAALSLVCIGLFQPPVRFAAEAAEWFTIGFACSCLNLALIEGFGPEYRASPSSVLARAAVYFLMGCAASALLMSLLFHFGFVSQSLAGLALLPVAMGFWYWRKPLPTLDSAGPDERSAPLLILLLLVLHAGMAGVVAGWLPILLSHRIGIGPEDGLWFLTLYWSLWIAGLLGAGIMPTRFTRGRILLMSGSAMLASCVLLSSTDNFLGATVAVVLIALALSGFSCLLAQDLSRRFREYTPRMFNQTLSITLAGGFFFAWAAGLLASTWGLTTILILPALGTAAVTALLLVLWLESKVTGR